MTAARSPRLVVRASLAAAIVVAAAGLASCGVTPASEAGVGTTHPVTTTTEDATVGLGWETTSGSDDQIDEKKAYTTAVSAALRYRGWVMARPDIAACAAPRFVDTLGDDLDVAGTPAEIEENPTETLSPIISAAEAKTLITALDRCGMDLNVRMAQDVAQEANAPEVRPCLDDALPAEVINAYFTSVLTDDSSYIDGQNAAFKLAVASCR